MSGKRPSKSEQDLRVRHAVSVLRQTKGLIVPEAMKLGGFNDTEGKDRALQMRVRQAFEKTAKKQKTFLMTLDEEAGTLPSNAKTPPEEPIAMATSNKPARTPINNKPVTSNPPVLETFCKTALSKQKDRRNKKKIYNYQKAAQNEATAFYEQEQAKP